MKGIRVCAVLCLIGAVCAPLAHASATDPIALYEKLRAFTLGEEVVRAENLLLKRDRIEMTFNGEFYFAEPIGGLVYGAVFVGKGKLHTVPSSQFERESVNRFLKSESIEATFSTAVLRFTDDTYDLLLAEAASIPGQTRQRALELATQLEDRLVRETGMNLSARLVLSVLTEERPGLFFGEFDGGDRNRFCALLDHQARILANVFEINGGEKGLLFQYRDTDSIDVWTAFYSEKDFARGRVTYADAFDRVQIPDYRMDIDLREADDWLRIDAELDILPLFDGLRLIPMSVNEGLGAYQKARLKKGMRVVSAALADGTPVGVIHHEWETGFSLVLPQPVNRNDKVTVRLGLEGRDTLRTWRGKYHYPRSTTTWYPRQGYLPRSRFHLTFRHRKKDRVVSVGTRLREGPSEDNADEWITEWKIDQPVSFISFAVGQFKRHMEEAEVAGEKVPVELYSVSWADAPVKEDFVLAELVNGVHYFSALYGDYPYGRLGAVYFPARFGQGFPTLLLLPVVGHSNVREFAFIAHEGAHQWWGNIVGWRSYRDQWLSEGFAEYSGAIYAGRRKKSWKDILKQVKEMRRALEDAPRTEVGVESGKLYEIGPIILGHRLSSRRTGGAYTALIYNKGALVLRMLNFLLSDPSSGNDKLFFDMMRDFVERHKDGMATTESFIAVASEHFARSPIGRKYRLKDLKWFMQQWVYQSGMPRYRLEYRLENQDGGGTMLIGTLYQEGVPENWFMVLPLALQFSGNRAARGTVHALGPATQVKIRLPEKPERVRLDPDLWVLWDKASVKKNK